MARGKTLMLAAAAVGLVLSTTGANAQTATPVPSVKSGKPQAPVAITGSLQSGNAALTVTFKAAAEEVTVRVYGTDGLIASGTDTFVTGRSFKAGETLTLAVAYVAGQEQGNLAVVVNGRFAGNQRSRIASFTVGDKQVSARKRSATTVDEKGRRIIVLPAKDK